MELTAEQVDWFHGQLRYAEIFRSLVTLFVILHCQLIWNYATSALADSRTKYFKLLLDLLEPFVLVVVSDVAIFQVGMYLPVREGRHLKKIPVALSDLRMTDTAVSE